MATKVGGQAVVEGVMMRSGERWAVAVRRTDGGIDVSTGAMPTWGRSLRGVPVVRGLVALAEALPVGARAARFSSSVRGTSAGPALVVLAAAILLPPPLIGTLGPLGRNVLMVQVLNLVIGAAVIAGCLAATGKLAVLRRVFEYHGAEHKVVAAQEAGVDLSPESVAGYSTRHIRCGTSLLLWMVVLFGIASLVPGLASSPLLLPLVVGVAAELQIRAAGAAARPWVAQALRPGLALQRLTTREPSADQLEVAIVALRAAMAPAEAVDAVVDAPVLAVTAA